MAQYRLGRGGTELVATRSPLQVPFVLWALVVFGVGIVARQVLPVSDSGALGGGTWLPLANWDAGHYAYIAQHGYSGTVVNRAFFPLLPLLMSAVHGLASLVGASMSFFTAGTVVATLSGFGAVVLLRRLLALDLGEAAASRYVWLLLLAPFAFFLLAPYTESILLLASVGAFLAARQRRWWAAGALGAVASACRLPGLIVFPALMIEYADQVRRGEVTFSRDVLGLVLAPLGTVTYFAYLALNGGLHTYSRAYAVGWPYRKFSLNILRPLYDPILAHVFHAATVPTTSLADALALLSFAVTLGLLIWGWRWLRPSYRVYAAISLVVPLLTTVAEGLGRYYLVIFPLYLIAARLFQAHPRLLRPGIVVGAAAEAILTALFVTGHPGVF